MFITRDSNNNIISAFACQQFDGQECLNDDNEKLQAFLNPPVNPNIAILDQISALEFKQARAVRDFIVRGDNSRVVELDNQITALRLTLVVEASS
jgi:hypothetical protein